MNKTEIEAEIAEETGINKKTVAEVLQSFQGVATRSLARGEGVRWGGFMNFGVKTRAARVGKNPKTGVEVDIPERTKVTLRVGKHLDAALNG
jgi:Bacterial nucleoid DNA-binding protein